WTVQAKIGAEAAAGKFSGTVRPGGTGEAAEGAAERAEREAHVTAPRATPGALLDEVKHKAAQAANHANANGGPPCAPGEHVRARACAGWPSMNIIAHGLPIDKPAEF